MTSVISIVFVMGGCGSLNVVATIGLVVPHVTGERAEEAPDRCRLRMLTLRWSEGP